MSDPRTPSSRAAVAAQAQLAPFAGFPYLVTRIGLTALRHVILLPADWPRVRLIDAARRQCERNGLDTAICFGPQHSLFLGPDGSAQEADFVPTGILLSGRLAPSVEISPDAELRAREKRLEAYEAEHRPDGYLVGDGLSGGRSPDAGDLARLAWSGSGTPPGLHRCPVCRELRGEFLRKEAGEQPAVIDVRCRCENPNRCARCDEALDERALSTWYWDARANEPLYVPAFVGLSHRCRRMDQGIRADRSE